MLIANYDPLPNEVPIVMTILKWEALKLHVGPRIDREAH